MKPVYEKIPISGDELYLLWLRSEPTFSFLLHHHPEYELTLITKGRGTRIVGDHIGDYQEGDLVLLGPNVPHTWSSAPSSDPQSGRSQNEAYILQFAPAFFSDPFLRQPDAAKLADLLQRSRSGLLFRGQARKKAERLIRLSHDASGLGLFVHLFHLFLVLSESHEVSPLATAEPESMESFRQSTNMHRIYKHIYEHSSERLGLEAVALRFNMTPSTLHRHLKKATGGRSLTQLVNEFRISHASSLLAHTRRSIAEICYECGYQNLSYFNRRFLELKQMTPSEYRGVFLKNQEHNPQPTHNHQKQS